MKRDIELLNTVYNIVDMGIKGIDDVLNKINDLCLEKVILDQKKEYNIIRVEAMHLLEKYDEKPSGISKIIEMSNGAMTSLELLKDGSDKNIARMMYEGSNKGIIKVTSFINEGKVKNSKVEKLANKLLEVLESNMNSLKKYL